MGAKAFARLEQKTPMIRNAATSAYVTCVARAITQVVTPNRHWEVRVFKSKEVNAFALPGGHIGVYTGLLKVTQNQDQLAAVLGHEIAHVIAGHSAARVSNAMVEQFGADALSIATGMSPGLIGAGANMLLLLPYSRADESEADHLGMHYMADAGFDPRQAVQLWDNMQKMEHERGGASPAILSDHPSSDTRIDDLINQLPQELSVYNQARAGRRLECGGK